MTHPRDLVLAATTLDRVAFISPGPGGEDPGPGHGIQGMCAAMAGAGARWLLARPLRAVCGGGGAVFFDGVGLRHGCATAAVDAAWRCGRCVAAGFAALRAAEACA